MLHLYEAWSCVIKIVLEHATGQQQQQPYFCFYFDNFPNSSTYDGHRQLDGMMETNYICFFFVSLNERTSPIAHFFRNE